MDSREKKDSPHTEDFHAWFQISVTIGTFLLVSVFEDNAYDRGHITLLFPTHFIDSFDILGD